MKILVVGGYTLTLKWHRMDMMAAFIDAGCEVVALGEAPEAEWAEFFSARKIRYRSYYIDRNGTNPLHDLKTMRELKRIFEEERPDKVFVYHTKANVYGSIAARRAGIDDIYAMVGGLGSTFNSKGLKNAVIRTILSFELKHAFKYAKKVFVQNNEDLATLVDLGIIKRGQVVLVHGSGVNTSEFPQRPLPESISFLFVGRLVRGKGVFEYLEACREVKRTHPEVQCHLVGPFDSNPTSLTLDALQPYIDDGTIIFHGEQNDVRPYLEACSVFVFPSYYGEGVPKIALEAMSTGRALVVADAVGCREVVQDGINGFLVPPRDVGTLGKTMVRCVADKNLVACMGEKSRCLADDVFDVRKVNATICSTMNVG